jgi:hypothetical protein
MRLLAAEEGARFLVIMTECSDPELHQSRVDDRKRDIPGWYEVGWSHVEESRKSWDPHMFVDLKIDTAEPLSTIRRVLDDEIVAPQ